MRIVLGVIFLLTSAVCFADSPRGQFKPDPRFTPEEYCKLYIKRHEYKLAVHWCEKVLESDKNAEYAKRAVAIFEDDQNTLFELNIKNAEKGDVVAFRLVAKAHAEGKGTAKNYHKAAHWWKKYFAKETRASDYDYFSYALILEKGGFGLSPNPNEAAIQYEKAARAGLSPAKRNLANLYIYGIGVTQDYSKAIHWLKQCDDIACEVNLALVMEQLGDKYKAFEILNQAAKSRYGEASYHLSRMYREGLAVPKDEQKAFELMHKAAEAADRAHALNKSSNDPHLFFYRSQYELGSMYENGIGVKINLIEANRWYRLAAGKGNQDASRALQRLSK